MRVQQATEVVATLFNCNHTDIHKYIHEQTSW